MVPRVDNQVAMRIEAALRIVANARKVSYLSLMKYLEMEGADATFDDCKQSFLDKKSYAVNNHIEPEIRLCQRIEEYLRSERTWHPLLNSLAALAVEREIAELGSGNPDHEDQVWSHFDHLVQRTRRLGSPDAEELVRELMEGVGIDVDRVLIGDEGAGRSSERLRLDREIKAKRLQAELEQQRAELERLEREAKERRRLEEQEREEEERRWREEQERQRQAELERQELERLRQNAEIQPGRWRWDTGSSGGGSFLGGEDRALLAGASLLAGANIELDLKPDGSIGGTATLRVLFFSVRQSLRGQWSYDPREKLLWLNLMTLPTTGPAGVSVPGAGPQEFTFTIIGGAKGEYTAIDQMNNQCKFVRIG